MNFKNQISQIKEKLKSASAADSSCNVFGASSHRYQLGAPVPLLEVEVFEQRHSIHLPDCYRQFILELGNGGSSYQNSGAGPFYGIFTFGENINEFADLAKDYLKQPASIYPKMTKAAWEELIAPIMVDEEIPDEVYDQAVGRIFAGLLPIGSQGCTYYHALVVTGPHAGRVVNIDLNYELPRFTFEANFLDWYERWLDEVISGELMQGGASWFGYQKGGSEEELLQAYLHGPVDEQEDNLIGLLNKKQLSLQITESLRQLLPEVEQHRQQILHVLAKTDIQKYKPVFIEEAKKHYPEVIESVYYYGKPYFESFLPIIQQALEKGIDHPRAFRLSSFILAQMGANYCDMLLPYLEHPQEDLRESAFSALGQLKNKNKYGEVFILGLADESAEVVKTILQAIRNIPVKVSVLRHYKTMLNNHWDTAQPFLLTNLDNLLRKWNLDHQELHKMSEEEVEKLIKRKKLWL